MPQKKRALSGKNLGVYAQKKAKQKDSRGDETPSTPALTRKLSMADQLGWDATNTEDPGPAPMDFGSDDEIESILSNMSEDEDVPTLDAQTLDRFLMKAANNIQEVVKRSGDTAIRGMKATYAVKLGQTQSKRTMNRHRQAKFVAERNLEGVQGHNKITKWFRRLSETQDKSLRCRSGKNNGRSLVLFIVLQVCSSIPEVYGWLSSGFEW